MDSGTTSKKSRRRSAYEAEIGYLRYEEASDKLSIPIQIRERHLTPDTEVAFLQAIGTDLQISIWSERDDIIIHCPLRIWRATGPYPGKLTGANQAHLTIGRFEDYIDVEESDDGPLVRATIHRIEDIEKL